MIKLTEPLTEKSRPTSFDEIIGQEEGIKALKAAIMWTKSTTCNNIWTSWSRKDCSSKIGFRICKENRKFTF